MASRVVMPKLSDTMEEGRILRWLRKEGESIETGQALAEVETDKATVEMESYGNGTILKLVTPEGQFVKVGDVIAIVGQPGEDVSSLLPPAGGAPAQSPAPAAAASAQPAPPPAAAAPAARAVVPPSPGAGAPAPSGRSLRASPLALRMAAEAGLDLASLQGSGPQGRIVKRDIEAALTQAPQPAAAAGPRARNVPAAPEAAAESEDVELSMVRRTIARRLVQSKGPVPHFYLTIDAAMDRVWDAYRALRDQKSPISINDIIIKAAALALRQHPELNASFAGDRVRVFSRVHIGMAVAVEDGLVTPVLRDADLKPLEAISEEARTLAERARSRKLQPDELAGSTFSISNLGMMGIEEFSAIINPPEAAILAVGAVRQVPVVADGAVTTGWRMKMTLSVDHRVADGAAGARFLQTLRSYLENPLLMA